MRITYIFGGLIREFEKQGILIMQKNIFVLFYEKFFQFFLNEEWPGWTFSNLAPRID